MNINYNPFFFTQNNLEQSMPSRLEIGKHFT